MLRSSVVLAFALALLCCASVVCAEESFEQQAERNLLGSRLGACPTNCGSFLIHFTMSGTDNSTGSQFSLTGYFYGDPTLATSDTTFTPPLTFPVGSQFTQLCGEAFLLLTNNSASPATTLTQQFSTTDFFYQGTPTPPVFYPSGLTDPGLAGTTHFSMVPPPGYFWFNSANNVVLGYDGSKVGTTLSDTVVVAVGPNSISFQNVFVSMDAPMFGCE